MSFRVFKDHQLLRIHPEAVNVRINPQGETELIGPRGQVVATYKEGEFHAIGNLSLCGGLEGDHCPICERLHQLSEG